MLALETRQARRIADDAMLATCRATTFAETIAIDRPRKILFGSDAALKRAGRKLGVHCDENDGHDAARSAQSSRNRSFGSIGRARNTPCRTVSKGTDTSPSSSFGRESMSKVNGVEGHLTIKTAGATRRSRVHAGEQRNGFGSSARTRNRGRLTARI